MLPQERAKRLPVPTEPARWAREVDGIQNFLKRLPAWEPVWGPAWCEAMEAYYRSRLELLQAHPPKPKRKEAHRGKRARRRSRC
jgi:hypothetical protein